MPLIGWSATRATTAVSSWPTASVSSLARTYDVTSSAPDTTTCGSFSASSAYTGVLLWKTWQVSSYAPDSYYLLGIRIACQSMGTSYLTFQYSVDSGTTWTSYIASVGGTNLAATTLTASIGTSTITPSSLWIRATQTNVNSRSRVQLWDVYCISSYSITTSWYPKISDSMGVTDYMRDVEGYSRYASENVGVIDNGIFTPLKQYGSNEAEGVSDSTFKSMTWGRMISDG